MAFPTTDMLGHRALRDRIEAALDRAMETPDVDFKQSATWEALKMKIVKAALGMGNLRSGGIVVVGVAQRGTVWELEGISDSDLATFDADLIQDALDQFASPAAQIEAVIHEKDSKTYLAILVHEFEELPFVCKKAGPDLERGGIYTRPLAGRPRTERVRSAEDMRELLTVAAEKGTRRIIEQATRLGFLASANAPSVSDMETREFDRELDGL